MPLNLINDPWIPVRKADGSRSIIAPWQMTEPGIAFPDWPRPDLNIACLELLVGLVLLADPPEDDWDWEDRRAPDPDRLRERLAPFAPAFNLLGEGPRFCQDLDPLEGKPNPPDMLFIDSAGANATKKNADLMVWRDRYATLPPALAAMALYTLQAFAPSGGAGNRTSMRGGGPMVTLVDPGGGLWPLIWANVPNGASATPSDLPWTRPCRTSEKKGMETYPDHGHPAEAFFGVPRRLRLVGDDGGISGVLQKPWGTNYEGWIHPTSPYYRVKVTTEWLPKHPKPGAFGYRNWLGVTMDDSKGENSLTRRAEMVASWGNRERHLSATVIVAGWSMDNMTARDFIFSRQPCLMLDDAEARMAIGMVEAAEQIGRALVFALGSVVGEGDAREAMREEFFLRTQADFEALSLGLGASNHEATARKWLAVTGGVALEIFEAAALAGLGEKPVKQQQKIVGAHGILRANTIGYGTFGRQAFTVLGLEPPAKRKERA